MTYVPGPIDNSADVIDSRDIIARIEHLSALEQSGSVDLGDDNGTDHDALFAELSSLRRLAEEADGCSDWDLGATLIRDSYFREYAQELAEDCGMIPDNLAWPCRCIDWEQATWELQMDYTSVEFDGVTYWVRS